MNYLANVVVATGVAQAVLATVMGVTLALLHRHYRRTYLREWGWSWWALAVSLLASSASLLAIAALGPLHPVRLLASVVSTVAAFWQAAWLLFGAAELVGRPVRTRGVKRGWLVALTALGLALSAAWAFDPSAAELRVLLRVGGRTLALGLAFTAAGVVLLRRQRPDGILGRRLVAVALLAAGLQQLNYFALTTGIFGGGANQHWVPYLGVLDLLLTCLVALATVIWLLEEEQQRAVAAAREAQQLAHFDLLTGLPNRRLLLEQLAATLERCRTQTISVAIGVLDLDRFKEVNDSWSHGFGDLLLRAVAERLRRSVREGDLLARLGGDEFALALPGAHGEGDATAVARNVLATLAQPFRIHHRETYVSACFGLAVFPADGSDPEELLRAADSAMSRAKQQGRGSFALFSPGQQALARERLLLENEFRRAFDHEELVLHYQPVLAREGGAIWGLEALVRWPHGERGLLLPADFLLLADEAGLLDRLGLWVLRTACAQAAVWVRAGHDDLRIAVNLPARAFELADLVERVHDILDATSLSPSNLELEITESMAMHDAVEGRQTLERLRALGIGIAIDDFGTGYSSLSYLRTLPIDTLKLDRSFVRDLGRNPNDEAIVGALVALAHALRVAVVGEGVETEAQATVLTACACDRFQGWLYSRAVPAAEIARQLDERGSASRRAVAPD